MAKKRKPNAALIKLAEDKFVPLVAAEVGRLRRLEKVWEFNVSALRKGSLSCRKYVCLTAGDSQEEEARPLRRQPRKGQRLQDWLWHPLCDGFGEA